MASEDMETEVRIRSIKVDKPLDLDFDIGNLMASDPNELDVKQLK